MDVAFIDKKKKPGLQVLWPWGKEETPVRSFLYAELEFSTKTASWKEQHLF